MGLLLWEMVGYQKRWISDTQLHIAATQIDIPSYIYLYALIPYMLVPYIYCYLINLPRSHNAARLLVVVKIATVDDLLPAGLILTMTASGLPRSDPTCTPKYPKHRSRRSPNRSARSKKHAQVRSHIPFP